MRKTKFFDIPVKEKTREIIRKKKKGKTYDEFLNEILNMELGL